MVSKGVVGHVSAGVMCEGGIVMRVTRDMGRGMARVPRARRDGCDRRHARHDARHHVRPLWRRWVQPLRTSMP